MSAAPRLVPASAAVPETLRLLDGYRLAAVAAGWGWALHAVDRLAEAARGGTLEGHLWVGPGGEAVGFAVPDRPSEVGRRLDLYLDAGYRTEAALGAFLDDLDRLAGVPPLVEVSDLIPGVGADARAAALGGRGFVPVTRTDYAYPPDRDPPAALPVATGTVRSARADDRDALADLLLRAYADNPIDLALFRQRPDPADDARAAIDLLFGTDLGPLIPSASPLVEVDGLLAAAVLVNDHQGLLITDVMVDPRYRRRGLARALLARSVAACRALGRTDVRLVVTGGNDRAIALYRSMGFVPIPGREGTVWLHAERLGLPPGPSDPAR